MAPHTSPASADTDWGTPRAREVTWYSPATLTAAGAFRYDAHLVPGLLANIEPMVDGWISYDDRGSDAEFSDEPARRRPLRREIGPDRPPTP